MFMNKTLMNGYNIYTTNHTGNINISTYSHTVDDSSNMDIDSYDEMICSHVPVNPENFLVDCKWFHSELEPEPDSKRVCRVIFISHR